MQKKTKMREQTGLVALYKIRSWNGSVLFCGAWSLHRESQMTSGCMEMVIFV